MTLDAAPGYLSAEDCRLADLIDLVSQKTDLPDYPHASWDNGARLRTELSRPACRPRAEAELARALLDGPGIVVLAGAFDDPWVIDRATRAVAHTDMQAETGPPPAPEAVASELEGVPRRRTGET